jgi:hypothetical protein
VSVADKVILYDGLLDVRHDLSGPATPGAVKEAALSGADTGAVLDAAARAHGAEDRRRFALKEVESAIVEVANWIVADVASERGVQPRRLHGEAASGAELVERAHEAADAEERGRAAAAERVERDRRYDAAMEKIGEARREHVRRWHERGGGKGNPEDSFNAAEWVSDEVLADANPSGNMGGLKLAGREVGHAVIGGDE